MDTEIIGLSDSRCSFGGVRITKWTDEKINDGVYMEGRDTEFSKNIFYLTLSTGNPATITKPGDLKIVATDPPINDSDCPQGGKRYESFIDIDGNRTYGSKVDTIIKLRRSVTGSMDPLLYPAPML